MSSRAGEIIRKSSEIFMRYGIRSISMDDLSGRLGISKKTMYLYVQNKTDLVSKVLDLLHEEDIDILHSLRVKKPNAIDYLLEMSRQICQKISQINPVMVFDLRKYYPDVIEKVVENKRAFYQTLFIKNLEDGIVQGLYRNDLNKELTIRLYIHNLEQFFDNDLGSGKVFQSEELFQVMFENHIRSIANENGLLYFEKQKKSLNFNI